MICLSQRRKGAKNGKRKREIEDAQSAMPLAAERRYKNSRGCSAHRAQGHGGPANPKSSHVSGDTLSCSLVSMIVAILGVAAGAAWIISDKFSVALFAALTTATAIFVAPLTRLTAYSRTYSFVR